MASNFYALNTCKDLLNIDITDTADDEFNELKDMFYE
jgi:hypothetical protein